MTKDEAKKLISFKNYCTCGGFAWYMSGRPQRRPHAYWCPQREEYNTWYDAITKLENKNV
jgi:hypothetical protein